MRIMAICPHFGARGKQREKLHIAKDMCPNKLDNLSSPGSAESCRQMPVITGKKI